MFSINTFADGGSCCRTKANAGSGVHSRIFGGSTNRLRVASSDPDRTYRLAQASTAIEVRTTVKAAQPLTHARGELVEPRARSPFDGLRTSAIKSTAHAAATAVATASSG